MGNALLGKEIENAKQRQENETVGIRFLKRLQRLDIDAVGGFVQKGADSKVDQPLFEEKIIGYCEVPETGRTGNPQ